MNNQEILQKVIEKAKKKGFSIVFYFNFDEDRFWKEIMQTNLRNYYYPIIFSHDFAKALWGTKNVHGSLDYPMPFSCDSDCYSGCHFDGQVWQYHLQQMAITDDPVKYLEKYAE